MGPTRDCRVPSDGETMEEIQAKTSLFNLPFEVAIGRCDNTDVDFDALISAYPAK